MTYMSTGTLPDNDTKLICRLQQLSWPNKVIIQLNCASTNFTHMSFGSPSKWLLVMADLPVPVGPTNNRGRSWDRNVCRKKLCLAVSLVWMINSLTFKEINGESHGILHNKR